MKRLTLLAAIAALGTGLAQAQSTELVIYKEANFRGQSDVIKGEVANLENGFGHEVSSMEVKGGSWEVCTGDHFKGRCRVVDEGRYPKLDGLNDRIVSVRFLGSSAKVARQDDRDLRAERREAREAREAQEAQEAAREERREARREWREYQDSRRDWDTNFNDRSVTTYRDRSGTTYYEQPRAYR
jgi:hypothetical protein